MNNAFPIEAALVDFLVLIVNILRACKHLLVALLLAESDYILTSVLLIFCAYFSFNTKGILKFINSTELQIAQTPLA